MSSGLVWKTILTLFTKFHQHIADGLLLVPLSTKLNIGLHFFWDRALETII